MQQKPSSGQPRRGFQLRRPSPRARLTLGKRRLGYMASVALVLAASAVVIHSLYNIQIKNGAMFRQYAAAQQLLDSSIPATRGEIYDASGITLASTSVVWTLWADPSYSSALYLSLIHI